MYTKCEHILSKGEYQQIKKRLMQTAKLGDVCSECDARSHLWACLQQCCSFVGCGKQGENHIGQHCQVANHHVTVSLRNMQLWCLACETRLEEPEESQEKIIDLGRERPTAKAALIDELESFQRPKGLCGLLNIGNSCYMNSAVQALSNCPPLTQFFMKCDGFIKREPGKPNVAALYGKLVSDIWHKRRAKYVVPNSFSKAFKSVYSHFRGNGQQDSQEFLRCLMDRLHEELKRPLLNVAAPVNKACAVDQGNHLGKKLLGGNCKPEAMDVELLNDEGVVLKERPLLEQDMYSADETGTDDDMNATANNKSRKKKSVQYHSIITDIFDGKLLSSVQCLTCNRVSTKVETFQDLSLPIPGKDDLARIHAPGSPVMVCSASDPGWFSSIWDWMRSWFSGPQVTLQDCLAAFFASDELKGDNMYNCEKCKKLRNGVKYSKVQMLPEVLCIHLKRFRHEMYYSSKIGSFVTFPIGELDMKPFLTRDCPSQVATYDLTSVITHFGNVGVGHYVAYAKNCINGKWYEFSDSSVSEVSESYVANAEAYVLFYSKRGAKAHSFRNMIHEHTQCVESDCEVDKVCYVSKEWYVRFDNCQEPGPITNGDILCVHGAIHPLHMDKIELLVVGVSEEVWDLLSERFGGGPKISSLDECLECKALRERRVLELDTFSKLQFQNQEDPDAPTNCLNFVWYRRWQSFVKGDEQEPPGPVDNSCIVESIDGQLNRKQDAEYVLVTAESWQYFISIYGGGPEVKTGSAVSVEESTEMSEDKAD